MTITSIQSIRERISSATEDSKIAVFIIYHDNIKSLKAVFDSTYSTRKRITEGCPMYVGSYSKDDHPGLVTENLRKAIR